MNYVTIDLVHLRYTLKLIILIMLIERIFVILKP